MTTKTLKELQADPDREARIEARLAKAREGVPDNWVELVAGSMSDLGGYDEVVRLGKEWRERQNWIEEAESE